MNTSDLQRIEDVLPLTALQEGLLFHALSQPGSDHYLVQFWCRLDGELDEEALRLAWLSVFQRHAALRAGFHWEDLDTPVQVIERLEELPWSEINLGKAGANAEADFQNALSRDRAQLFDLSRPPLMRWTLFRLGPGQARLLWTYHHIVLDGWSMATVIREVFGLYQARLGLCEAAALPLYAFRDFLAATRALDQQSALDAWRQCLAGVRQATPLCPDTLPLASAGGSEYAEAGLVEQRLTPEETAALGPMLQARQLTLASLVQGLWALLLASACGEGDVVFGSTVSGRNLPQAGIEYAVGLLINTVPQRVRVNAEVRLADWLAGLQAAQASLREYEYCSLVDIQGVSRVPRNQALFESVVVVENYPMEERAPGDALPLQVSGFETVERIGVPITLMLVPGPQLRIRLFFDAQRFPLDVMRNCCSRFCQLLRGTAAAMDAGIADFLTQQGLRVPRAPATDGAPGQEASRAPRVLPQNELETRLTQIWAELLEVPECGIDDDFYVLGGHSLSVLRMRSRILDELGREISIVDLMQYATVRRLARFLAQQGAQAQPSAEALNRAGMRTQKRAAIRRGRGQSASG